LKIRKETGPVRKGLMLLSKYNRCSWSGKMYSCISVMCPRLQKCFVRLI